MTGLHNKKDFSLLNDEGLVYLDTAATSQTPQVVLDAMQDYYLHFRANTHRGLYSIAEHATKEYEQARERIAYFIGATPDEIIFTSSATMASNMLTYALEQSLDFTHNDEIVTTVMEHHASLVPLQQLAKRTGAVLRHIPLREFDLDYEQTDTLITPKTKIVAVVLASNVLGTIADIARIAKRAHKVGALMIVDATAAVGHIAVDVKKLDVDFLYFSGHKMCGPTGIGILYGKRKLLETLEPGFFGGGIVEKVTLDDAIWCTDIMRFEAGTPNIAGAIGLGAAVAYLSDIDIADIHTHIRKLVAYMHKQLLSIKGVTIYAAPAEKNVGIVSFTLDGIHPHDIAQVAAQNNVAIRAGHHCAMPLHHTLNVPATARASFYFYNTQKDIDALVRVIKKAHDIFAYHG